MNRLKIVMATMVAMICVLTVSAQTAEEASASYNKAAELLGAGKTADAIPLLEQAIEIGLKSDAMEIVHNAQKILPQCYFSRGLGFAKASKLDEATADFNKAAELAELYGDPGTLTKAKTMISKVYAMMAANAFNAKDYKKAAEIFEKGYTANPKDTELGMNLATSYCEMEPQNAKGFEIYKAIIALGDTHSKYVEPAAAAKDKYGYYKLLAANKFAEAKAYDSVYVVVDDILVVDPTNANALMMAIQVATNAKDPDKVLAYGDKAIAAQKTPELKSAANFLVGAVYQNNKEDKAKAIEYYKKVVAGPNVATAKAQIAALSK